jgi:N-acetylglucosaminylphosphatidylinositol deacetylase
VNDVGNAEGLGSIRKQELHKSAILLGLKSSTEVTIVEDDSFPDSMTTQWPAAHIADLLTKHIYAAETDTIITFDGHGVSSHPNHRSLYNGALELLSTHPSPPELYTLTTTNTVRKYLSLLDIPFTVFRVLFAHTAGEEQDSRLLFISGAKGYAQARKAMTEAHKSQMVWFRWGWIGLSRYMVVNDLKRVEF